MKKKLLAGLPIGLVVFGTVVMANATAIDLSSWSADTYDFAGGQTAGNWVLSETNTVVTQTINADSSVYLNNLNQTSYQMYGHWQVTTTGDNDFIGFVFGYQNDHQFYTMDWKQGTQDAGSAYGETAQEGFRILKFDAGSRSDLDLTDCWGSGTSDSTILASSYGNDKGWANNTSYDFHLDFAPGVFNVRVYVGGTTSELWNVTVHDSTYAYGQFGFYNFSQASVEYSGFEQTGGVIVDPVPELATMLLFGTGLVGLAGTRIRRKKK